MSITTKEKVKEIAGITATDLNNLIDAQILIVEEFIHDYCNTDFIHLKYSKYNKYGSLDKGWDYCADAIVSARGNYTLSAKTITGSGFDDFQTGDSIFIKNSIRNNGNYTITNVTSTVITVDLDLSSETSTIDIYLLLYPKPVSNVATRMVAWDIVKRNKGEGLRYQRIIGWGGGYSDNISGYPKDIISGLKPFILQRGM